MTKAKVQAGTKVAPERFHVEILKEGPYLVYGSPALLQQIIMTDSEGGSWTLKAGLRYATDPEPAALCRCGYSKDKPYCDGAHMQGDWDPCLAEPDDSLLDGAQEFRGPIVNLSDNTKYCAFARFCDPRGQVWNLVGVNDRTAAELTIREANHCLAGRLSAWDKNTDKPYEPSFEPSLGLVQDPHIGVSGPLWVRGGIKITTEGGQYTYEVRNRVALCRCGQSSNKPFCNGAHASMKFRDGLPVTPEPDGEEF